MLQRRRLVVRSNVVVTFVARECPEREHWCRGVDGVFVLDLLRVAFCDDSASYSWSLVFVDPSGRHCFSDDVVVGGRRIYFVVDVM